MSGQPEVADLTTAEGCVAWMKELPTENLHAIAARPLDQFNALLVCAAEGELVVRDTTTYADEHECGQLRLAVPGEQVSLLPLPDSLIPTTQDEED